MSRVTCSMSHLKKKKLDKVVNLIGGWSVINGAYHVYLFKETPCQRGMFIKKIIHTGDTEPLDVCR